VQKCGIAGQPTGDTVIQHMHFACWETMVTNHSAVSVLHCLLKMMALWFSEMSKIHPVTRCQSQKTLTFTPALHLVVSWFMPVVSLGKIFIIFLSWYKYILGQHVTLGITAILYCFSNLFFISNRTIFCYIVWAVESSIISTMNEWAVSLVTDLLGFSWAIPLCCIGSQI